MEACDLGYDFLCGRPPYVDVNKLALGEFRFLSTAFLVAGRAIEGLACHLACGYDVTIRVHCHRHDILVMHVEERLLVLSLVVDDTDTGCSENNISVGSIFQVATGVETAEAVSPLECQAVIWRFAHRSLDDEIVRDAGLNLTTPNVNAAALITFAHVYFAKFAVIRATKTSVVFFDLSCVFIKVFTVVCLFSDLLRLGRSILVHEVFPLEDGLVLTTG